MIGDEVNTYTYDDANRLIAVNGQSSSTSYAYDGLGYRLQQTVGSQTTTYTLDINTNLSQILSDGTNTYLYGADRIAQQSGTDTEYFMGDALDSVRQLTNATGDVTLARAYDPYGNTILDEGSEQTAYGYTGEYTDSTGLIYLRARYYDPLDGRFKTLDSWSGNNQWPDTFNGYEYGVDNPILYSDPTGQFCLAGFNVTSWGKSCTDEDRLDAANKISRLGGLLSSPHFAEGYLYEIADTMMIFGPEVARTTINLVINNNAFLKEALNSATADPTLSCQNLPIETFLQFLKNGVQGDEYFQAGRVAGRVTMVVLAVPEVSLGIEDTAVMVAASPFTAGLTLTGAAVTVSITAAGAAFLADVAFKEADDHLVTNFITGKGTSSGSDTDLTQWGWRGSSQWRKAVQEAAASGTHETILGKIPTEDEAKMLIEDSDGEIIRIEEGHDFPNPHSYPHINYYTSSGAKATIRIQEK